MVPLIWRLKGRILRLVSPLFFRSVGKGTLFTGRVRLPLPRRNIDIGADCMIGHDVFFQTGRGSSVSIGRGCSLNTGCHIVASDKITIGDDVAIGEYVSIRDQEHRFTPQTGVKGQGFNVAPIEIGDRVWIGRGVYIGPGSIVGAGSIVAANSVLRGQYPPNVLLAGAPAVIKRNIHPSGETSVPSDAAEQ
ncbi:MAG: acyltransferase [Rhodobacteraceae bacterium]|nr:acyltransferase [Paracoccaceae bacterium]